MCLSLLFPKGLSPRLRAFSRLLWQLMESPSRGSFPNWRRRVSRIWTSASTHWFHRSSCLYREEMVCLFTACLLFTFCLHACLFLFTYLFIHACTHTRTKRVFSWKQMYIWSRHVHQYTTPCDIHILFPPLPLPLITCCPLCVQAGRRWWDPSMMPSPWGITLWRWTVLWWKEWTMMRSWTLCA